MVLETGFEDGIGFNPNNEETIFGGREFAEDSGDILASSPIQFSTGNRSLKVLLNKVGPMVANSRRAELTKYPANQSLNDVVWLGFSIFVPADFRNFEHPAAPNYTVVMQWHGNPDRNCGEPYRRPPLSLLIDDTMRWRIWLLAQQNPCEKDRNHYDRKTLFADGDWTRITTDNWTHWVIAWKRSHSDEAAGWFKVWKAEGSEAYSQAVTDRGTNYFNDEHAGYLKIGLYKSPFEDHPIAFPDDAREYVYYDDVRLLLTKNENDSPFQKVAPSTSRVVNLRP